MADVASDECARMDFASAGANGAPPVARCLALLPRTGWSSAPCQDALDSDELARTGDRTRTPPEMTRGDLFEWLLEDSDLDMIYALTTLFMMVALLNVQLCASRYFACTATEATAA